jgi:YVTN family beta-propeller protein
VSTVAVVDLDRQEVVDTLTVERAPVGMGLGRQGERIYAANRGTGCVSVIDRRSGREWARVPVGKAPGDLAVDQQSGTVYVSDAGTSTVSVFQDRLEGEPAELPSDWRHPLIGKPLPPFTLPDMADGRPRTAEEFRGKKYILNFFASW